MGCKLKGVDTGSQDGAGLLHVGLSDSLPDLLQPLQ